MGPPKSPTSHPENQEGGRHKRSACRPRSRRCLLKGCEQRFRPRRGRQRYCSEECRKAARAWSRWKAQESYRATVTGKQKRNGQSRRYRERVRSRKPPAGEAVPEAARVITKKFFRRLLRPAWLLRRVRAPAALAVAALLFARVPACDGARLGTRAALAKDTRRLSGIPRGVVSKRWEWHRQLTVTY
jgi:hypothetical protein